MPAGKNCPNCGAPYDPALNKCPYCGTIYFDLSCLDLTSHDPIYLKLKQQIRDHSGDSHDMVVTQKCIPQLGDAEVHMEQDCTYCTNYFPQKLVSIRNDMVLTTNLSFRAVPDKHGALCYVEVLK